MDAMHEFFADPVNKYNEYFFPVESNLDGWSARKNIRAEQTSGDGKDEFPLSKWIGRRFWFNGLIPIADQEDYDFYYHAPAFNLDPQVWQSMVSGEQVSIRHLQIEEEKS